MVAFDPGGIGRWTGELKFTVTAERIAEYARATNDPIERHLAFDAYHPSSVLPLVAYLASAKCPITGKVYSVQGGAIQELSGWHAVSTIETDEPWTIAKIQQRLQG